MVVKTGLETTARSILNFSGNTGSIAPTRVAETIYKKKDKETTTATINKVLPNSKLTPWDNM